jgi:nucleoside-diphosphate-sugar epimerase
MRLLITGANGFLGRAVVSTLLNASVEVLATDQSNHASTPDVVYRSANIRMPDSLAPLMEKIDTVVHCAGLAHVFDRRKVSATAFRNVNEAGTANVARAAAMAGIRHFILISSVSVYGDNGGRLGEDAPCHPETEYAQSKYEAELRAREAAQTSGMRLTILRLATLYGEEDPGNVRRLMRSLDQSGFLWIGDGRNCKSLLYRGDAARACLAVLNKPPASGVATYNVSAPPCTMREIVETLSTALGKKPLPVRVPAALAVQTARLASLLPVPAFARLPVTIDKWLAEDIYDTRRIEQEIGFYPEVTLNEGIRREVHWYREQQAKERG